MQIFFSAIKILLALSLVGIPLLLYWNKVTEADRQLIDSTYATLGLRVLQWNQRAQMINELNLLSPLGAQPDGFERVPVLSLPDNQNYNLVEASQVSHSIMKGKDQYGRPFITLKIRAKEDLEVTPRHIFPNDQLEEYVLVVFQTCQTFQNMPFWTIGMQKELRTKNLINDFSDVKSIIEGQNDHFELVHNLQHRIKKAAQETH